MPTYELLQVDAFTDRPLAGNPCAIVMDADGMDGATMQAVAREMNLSETSFVIPSEVADFGVRYFTPAEEIPLAGHPTIATGWALADTGRIELDAEGSASVTFELMEGPIRVDLEGEEGELERVVMTQRKPRFLSVHDPARVLPAFGLSEGALIEDAPIQTVSTGTPQLMIPVRSLDVLRSLRVDPEALNDLRRAGDFFSVHVFCVEGLEEGDTFARHFAGPPDLFEDPFTGSATGGMAAYLWHHGLLDEPSFTAEQGHWMGRPGKALVEVVGPRDDMEAVRVGGPAVTVMEGRLTI